MRRLHQDARDQTGKAEQKLALAVSNNVGVEVAKKFFVSMTYALVRSEGGRIYCDIKELPKFVEP
jgi:hypothetical protein